MKKSEINNIVGEKRINNEGFWMEIIEYNNSHNCTIKFDDGTIRKYVYYHDFCRGAVRKKTSPKDRVGEKRKMRCGDSCELIEWKDYNHCTFRFDSGVEKVSTYQAFQRGMINSKLKNIDLVGKTFIAKNGEKYTVKSENDGQAVCVFENGKEKVYSRSRVITNNIASVRLGEYKVGEEIRNKYGKTYVVEKVNKDRTIDVVDEEGTQIKRTKKKILMNQRSKKYRENKSIEVAERRVNAVIGETAISTSGKELTIIGGTSLSNLTICTRDGRIITNIKHHKFKNNQVCEKSQGDTVKAKYRSKRVGETIKTKAGYIAEIIEYNADDDIVVSLDTGEIVNTTYQRFKDGIVAPRKTQNANGTSLNEFTLQYILSNYGFVRYPKGTLCDLPGFGNMELDLYNPKYRIAVEYDGYPHINTIGIDKRKDLACRDNGIRIFRIRESKVPLLNDGISREYKLKDDHYFSEELKRIISELVNDISGEIGVTIEIPDFSDEKFRNEIKEEYSNKTAYRGRIGEINYNSQGEKMTLTNYKGCTDVDVRFENGYEVRGRSYTDFRRGKIQCKFNHLNEEALSRCGQKMRIISDIFGQMVDVEFEDGTIVNKIRYHKFKTGNVKNPNYDRYPLDKFLGRRVKCKNGLFAETVDVWREKGRLRVKVRFDDGIIIPSMDYGHFKDGYVKYPK